FIPSIAPSLFLCYLVCSPLHSRLFPYTTLFRSVAFEQRHVQMHPRAFVAFQRLGHEGGVDPVLERHLLHREAERHDVVRHREGRSEEHTSELQSRENLACRLLLAKKKANELV